MRFLTNDDVDRLLTPADARIAVRSAFEEAATGTGAIHGRTRSSVGDVKLSTLGGVLTGAGALGAKVYSTVAGRFTFLVVLFAADDGRRLAVLESDAITRLRTAAVTVVGAEHLARPEVRRAVVFGAGVQARGHLAALRDAYDLDSVVVVARTERPDLDGAPVTTDGRAAVARADLVVTATRSSTPLFPAAWLPDGVHVSAVGSSLPTSTELGLDVYERADRVVAEWRGQATTEAGGLIQAVDAGALSWDDVPDLADVVAGRAPGRTAAGQVTVLQATGIGIEDVALAAEAFRRAESLGAGQVVR